MNSKRTARSRTKTRRIGLGWLALLTALSLGLAAVGCSRDPRKDPAIARLLQEMQAPDSRPLSPGVWRGDALFLTAAAHEKQSDAKGAFWARFRKAYPFGMQGIAISAPGITGKRSVIVAEPPPHVSLEDLKDIIRDAAVLRLPVGHDGAAYDVVGTLEANDEEAVRAKIRLLSILLYRTDYGAYAYQEPFTASWRDGSRYHLDISPTAAELHAWLYSPDAAFEPVAGGEKLSRSALLARASSSVYRLAGKAIVVWFIPDTVSVSDCMAEIRIFALEGDLIIGAVHDVGLMLVARQRMAPYDVLPPLRGETVALLAAAREKAELAQSYQRTQPGAGDYTSAYDWAPILLSPELVDTEYGQLLNTADQLLKGWSQHGEVMYENFDYPPPQSWPFEAALSWIVRESFHSDRVTFNWNTTGTGYSVAVGKVKIYALFRTGALPISYIPGEDARQSPEMVPYEDRAYEWYAGLNNPELTRVVQYAALYQVFHNLGVICNERAPSSAVPAAAFKTTMAGFWDTCNSYGQVDLPRLAANAPVEGRVDVYLTLIANISKDKRKQAAARQAIRDGVGARMAMELLENGFAAWKLIGEAERVSLEGAASTLEGPKLEPLAREKLRKAGNFLSAVAARERLADRYANAVAATGKSWIHTPAVVMSNAGLASPLSIGGHNLRANVTELEASAEVQAGQVRLRGTTVELNEADVQRAPDVVREAARGLQAGEEPEILGARLGGLLKTAAPRPIRPPEVVLGPREGATSVSARVLGVASERIVVPQDVLSLIGDAGNEGRICFVRRGDHIWVSGTGSSRPIVTSNLADASELASLRIKARPAAGGPAKTAELRFLNVAEGDRETILKNVRAAAKERGYSEDIVAVVSDERPGNFKWLKADTYDFENPKIRIGRSELINGERVSKVTVELTAKPAGIRNALIEFWVKFKTAVSELEMSQILQAIQVRIREVFTLSSTGRLEEGLNPLVVLQKEMNRLKLRHNIEIETHVHEAAGDWRLVAILQGASYA